MPQNPAVSLLAAKAVCARVGLHRQRLYELMARDAFPSPIRIGPRIIRWRSDDIDRWIEQLSAARAAA